MMETMVKQPIILQTARHTGDARPWRFIVFGGICAGKTTLLRALENKDPAAAGKSQMIDYSGWGIDTPGEYNERSFYRRVLMNASFDSQMLVIVQDATNDQAVFPPHYFLMFPQPAVGVVTKVDLPQADIERARSMLRAAGVTGEIFCVSAFTGEGISALRDFLLSQNI